MKQYYVKDLKADDSHHLEDRFLVKNADIRDGNNNKRHLYMTLADATGEIQAVKWSLTPDEVAAFSKIKAGMVITVGGRCNEYMGKKQLVLDVIKGQAKEGSYDKADLFKAAPENSGSMYDYIISRIEAFEDEELKKLCLSFYEENKEKMLYYPAAMSNHHAEYGGLSLSCQENDDDGREGLRGIYQSQ